MAATMTETEKSMTQELVKEMYKNSERRRVIEEELARVALSTELLQAERDRLCERFRVVQDELWKV